MLHSVKRLTSPFALLLVLSPAFVFGQTSFEAQVRGVVRDATGGVIIGAKVIITEVATNISSSATTNERGSYIFNALRPATYSIRAETPGFRSEETKNVVTPNIAWQRRSPGTFRWAAASCWART
jgi:hypothetical protein